ncbi:MAG: 5-oxoprolinase subunit PxpB [Pirellulales bacterium]|nr:5-oxoprolinase subunit PxpB [Pirellulales bacterium]
MPKHGTPPPSPIVHLGDSALAIPIPGPVGTAATTALVRAVADEVNAAALPGVVDVIPSPDRVTVCYDATALDRLDQLEASLRELAGLRHQASITAKPTVHTIEVSYGGAAGPDLEDVCKHCGLSREALIQRHTASDYLVTAVGFTPGFAYLGGLDPRLAVPRRATPRTEVPAGSVGLGGAQTGVYPCASPGGWQIIGHTDARFFDPTSSQPALCAVGDRVRFVDAGPNSAGSSTSAAIEQHRGPSRVPHRHRGLSILEPGLMTTVQDLGRVGYRSSGVTLGGAADPAAAAVANLLVGNPPDAAVLEITLAGPTFRLTSDLRLALTGGRFPGLPSWRPIEMPAGSTVALGHASHGCRGYLAVAGGLEVPLLLGSRSTHLAAGFGGLGGRTLATGDWLAAGPSLTTATDAHWSLSPELLPLPVLPARLRLLPSTETATEMRSFFGTPYRVTASSNRMGLRLAGSPLTALGDGVSRAVVPGTVQLPPDGQPILLLNDCQTIGGYPVLGHVASADLRLAAQLRPGDTLLFEPVTRSEAHASQRHQQQALASIAARIADRWPSPATFKP